ncbi:MAG: hypothetical protein HDS67_02265 [Bacteroidales bacterium]|nr:hypothetical protein [Bacteroidales bacterium]
MPWGADNQMPYKIMDLIESDETLSTCQDFNAEICYGAGLQYDTSEVSRPVASEVEDFFKANAIPQLFLGSCIDFKHFGFAVTVVILSRDRSKIVRAVRKEACYCRFSKADDMGRIDKVHFANWRLGSSAAHKVESIPLLDPSAPLADLRERVERGDKECKYAIVSRIPTVDHTYYPIPSYASLFKSKWYDIKKLIATAKEAKLRNSAPIRYHITIANTYWKHIFEAEHITDRVKQMERIAAEKQNIIDFITGAENSGKVLFSTEYVNPTGQTVKEVTINKVDSSKEGGDWETDIQEAVNMVCFTMRVHSNLVGSVPGKAQTNNSGSDKRELYTIAQALQKPYRDILFGAHDLIIGFNGWRGVKPVCPFMQLTTLDEHTDAKKVDISQNAQKTK